MSFRSTDIPASHKATTFQLDPSTVSPTRIIERDEDGFDIEETISCYPIREKFLDRAGNLCEVVLCNSRTTPHNSEAMLYAAQVRADWIRAGGLPIAECPHAANGEYKRTIGTDTLVKPPANYKPCQGSPTGCEHFQAQVKHRKAQQAAKHAKQEKASASISADQLEKMGAAFGQQLANAMSPAQRLRSNQSEKDD